MNWNLIIWFAGVLGTIYGLKFVMEAFKSLLGKESRESIMDAVGNSISKTNKKMTKKLKERSQRRKQKQEEERRAIVRVL